MDWNRVEGNWKQFKGAAKEKWGKLTDDDLNVIEGRREQLEGKLQQRYGFAKDQIHKDVDDWFRTLEVESPSNRKSPGNRRGFFALRRVSLDHRDVFQQRDHADDDHDDARDLLGAAVERQQVDQIENENNDEKRDECTDKHAGPLGSEKRC